MSKDIAAKFYFQQLFDIGDILGAFGVVLMLKVFKKPPVSEISSQIINLFLIELAVE